MGTGRLKGLLLVFLLSACGLCRILIAQESPQVQAVTSPDNFEDVQVLYAQSCLDLAKFELKSAEEIESSLSFNALERRRLAVKIAEERLRVAKLPAGENDTVSLHLRFTEEKAKKARSDYLRAVASKAFTASQIEHMRLKAEVAKRQFAVMSNPIHLMSMLDHMHWEIDRLNEAVIALELRIAEAEKR